MEILTLFPEDIFEDIPGERDIVIRKFPPALIEQTGWKEGDTLDIQLENGAIIIKKI